MKELSLNILDIAENSVKARASLIEIALTETAETLEIRVKDDGCGMQADFLKAVCDPFTTTRKTRRVGLGIPLFKLAAEQTGGEFGIESYSELDDPALCPPQFPAGHGTETRALFCKNHIDMTPLGDVISTLVVLVQGNPDIDIAYLHSRPEGDVSLDTRVLREVLGDTPLCEPEVLIWIRASLEEEYNE